MLSLTVLKLSDQCKVVGIHCVVSLDGGLVGSRVLSSGITTVEESSDFTRDDTSVVVLEVLEVEGNPSTVDEDAAFFSILVQVGVEGSNDLDAFLAVSDLLNLNFLRVVEDASDLDLLEGEIILELIQVL